MISLAEKAKLLAEVQSFALLVTFLLDRYPSSVTSWTRSPKHNENVGGKPESLHLKGLAVDIVFDDPTANDVAVNYAHELGLDAVNETNHVHVELDRNHNRK